MIFKYNIIEYAKQFPDKCWYIVSEDETRIINKATGEDMCSMDTLVEVMRDKLHCNFEVIYSCHPTLETTLRCKECGTVIFTHEDERWEPNLCCPVCSDYKTNFEYWTAKEIKNDKKKQNSINFLIKIQEEQEESYRRQKRRNGKCDWQIGKCKMKFANKIIVFELQCDNLFRTKLKGLKLRIAVGTKCEDHIGYIINNYFTIPLSISAAKTVYKIHKHNRNKPEEIKNEN